MVKKDVIKKKLQDKADEREVYLRGDKHDHYQEYFDDHISKGKY